MKLSLSCSPKAVAVNMLAIGIFLPAALQIQAQTNKPAGGQYRDTASMMTGRANAYLARNNSTAAVRSQANVQAFVPRLMKYNGVLRDAAGKPLTGTVDVTFSLYNSEAGGDALWYETQCVQADDSGHYTVMLGAMHSEGLPIDLFTSIDARWLGIQVGSEQEQEPRALLVSVPYALKAGDAETLGGKPATAYMLSDSQGASTSSSPTSSPTKADSAAGSMKTQKARTSNLSPSAPVCSGVTSNVGGAISFMPVFTSTCNVENSVINQVGALVGIGTVSPMVAVDVTGNNAGLRLKGTGTHQVILTGATSGRLGQDALGFFFASDSVGSSIRLATNNGTSREWMRITSAGNVGIGTTVPGATLEVNGAAKFDEAVTLAAPATSGSPAAALSVQATDLNTPNFGVYSTSSGLDGTGIYGEADNGSLAVGVWGNSTSGLAGLFSGDVQVSGNLIKSGGSFKIDDPIDPENKYLYHSFVESPDMKNIYDGVVLLDANGDAVVTLPDWFEALNRDFRYQLTCVGGYAPVYVAQRIKNNKFKIAGGTPGLEVDWLVTGIRHDAWADAHRIPIEEAKPPQERGYYLHPELFGAPPQNNVINLKRTTIPKLAK